MFASNLPGPVLSLALDPVSRIQQSDAIAVGGLWSVLTKVRDAVTDGQRLENLTWRLWYRTRATPGLSPLKSISNTLSVSSQTPSCRPLLPSPSSSFLSSSDGTSTGSDWDRETAVGDSDEGDLQSKNSGGALRSSVISPPAHNARLDLGLGSNLQYPLPYPPSAPSQSRQELVARASPLASPSHYTPHHAVETTTDAGHATQTHGTSSSDSQHHSLYPAQPPPGLALPSLSPHEPIPPLSSTENDSPNRFPDTSDAHLLIPLPRSSIPSGSVVAAAATTTSSTTCAFSMPVPLPLPTPREENSTVGRLIARVFADSTMDMRGTHRRLSERQRETETVPCGNSTLVTPKIIEPRLSLFSVVSSSPVATASAVTSATSTPRQSFPTVVIVNPTPHPTPPATPSVEESDARFDLNIHNVPISRPDSLPATGWSGSANGQLSTPVSINGDARSVDESSVNNIMESNPPRDQQSRLDPFDYSTSASITRVPGPAGMIVLPERPVVYNIPSPLPTPTAEVVSPSEMATCIATKSTIMPIPTAPSEDKKFFLAAPHSGSGGSGHDSTESPDSLGLGSISPLKRGAVNGHSLLNPRDRQDNLRKEEDTSSSLSASSPRAPSITSSKGGTSKHKGRAAFTVPGSCRRKTGKKAMHLTKDSHLTHRNDAEIHPTAEGSQGRSVENGKKLSTSKGKEREVVGQHEDEITAASEASAANPVLRAKSMQQLPHRSTLYHQHTTLHLRQLPTNPPRRHPSPARRNNPESAAETLSRTNSQQTRPNARQPSYHPQLGPIGLSHLPTVPPKSRRPIEITETSSDYSTTDTDGDDSSWESESISDGGGKKAVSQSGPSRTNCKGSDSSKYEKKAGVASGSHSRTRDPGEFARDAALEAQRQKDLFQKLPVRSYSNLAQLPRTKSGLSLLFRPDPESFPEGHPYRTSRSSQDLVARNWSVPAPPLVMTAVTKRAIAMEPIQAAVNVSSVHSKTDVSGMVNGRTSSAPHRSGYRPRVKPADQVEESDSEDEDPEDGIQVSSSIAERRLAVLIGAQGTKSVSHSRKPSPSQVESQLAIAPDAPQPATRIAAMPVAMHPFLPEPAPLQTPQTIRRNIISQELDEELRRNLLWERSQNQIQGRPPRAPGSILPGPWRTLTVTPLRPIESASADSKAANAADRQDNRSFATQRTKSWAGDYHASGW